MIGCGCVKRLVILSLILFTGCSTSIEVKPKLVNKDVSEYIEYTRKNNLEVNIEEVSSKLSYGTIVSYDNESESVLISDGKIYASSNKFDELGLVPIMMYHGIENTEGTFLGNVDKMGYNRTVEAFKKDLEFYYNSGYRAIRLIDYVNGIINVEEGKSPIVLTFDDGNANNIRVLGIEDGEIIIDPNSAIGIMEQFKKNHPDFNVTATFFLHSNLFAQPKYNKEIMNWLIKHGYDIGNHTYSHSDLSKLSVEEISLQVMSMYELLGKNTSLKYVNIVSLPFGAPYGKGDKLDAVLNSNTVSTLRVGWEANQSPFSKSFDKTYIKRIRAYDNNGLENDIESEFKKLEKLRYISDGNSNIITINKEDASLLNTKLKVVEYETK